MVVELDDQMKPVNRRPRSNSRFSTARRTCPPASLVDDGPCFLFVVVVFGVSLVFHSVGSWHCSPHEPPLIRIHNPLLPWLVVNC